ncbi:MAG: flagellar protein FlgN [Burkholderiaceae bacterium]|nr:flagellar protein FlgN [Burkholderiaceae bacterium]
MQSVTPLTCLREEQKALVSLLALIKLEQQHLVTAQIDGLPAVTAQKSELVHQLGQLANQRHSALEASGCARQESGMEAWLASSGDSGGYALWQEVLGLTREAKELNRVNGILINKHMSNNQSALHALRRPTQGSSTLYGPSGQATNSPASRRFVIG